MYDEVRWRLGYLWAIVKLYICDIADYKSHTSMFRSKKILNWSFTDTEGVTEYHTGNFGHFIKWLITHKKVF